MLEFTNKYGYTFNIGDDAYYNYMLKDNGNIVVSRTRIKSFIAKEDGIYIMSRYKYISIDLLYPTYSIAKEVIEKWQKEELNTRIRKEMSL